jgi:hypothetical protein
MTPSPVRSKVAVVTTTLGLAVLLAGPTNTFGLGVPAVGDAGSTTTQVTNAVQGVAQTTQQTAATTVTNVESSVQTTTQAAAPQALATLQPAAAPPAAAPTVSKQVTTRAAAPPTKRHVAAVSRPHTQPKPVAAATQLAKQAGGAFAAPVRSAAPERTRAKRAPLDTAPSRTTNARAQDVPADCNVPALAGLPGGSQLQALIAFVCDAAAGLDLPARIGLVDAGVGTPAVGDVRGAAPRGIGGPAGARPTALNTHPTARSAVVRPAAAATTSAAASQPGQGVGGPVGVGPRRGGGPPYLHALQAANVTAASGAGTDAGDSTHHHHGFFSGQSRGAEILMAILFASLSTLAGIALWRLAARFVIPRFA